MNSEAFKNTTEGLKNIALVLAVAIGGLWTAWMFRARLEQEQAQAQLAHLQAEAAIAQQAFAGRPAPWIDLSAQLLPGTSWPRSLVVRVALENKGTRDIALSYDNALPFAATRLVFQRNGSVAFVDKVAAGAYSVYGNGQERQSSEEVVLAGTRTTLEGLFQIQNPGLYLVTFHSRYQPRELAELKSSTAVTTSNPYDFSSSIYVAVP